MTHWDSHTNIIMKSFEYFVSDQTLTYEELKSLYDIAARDGFMSDAEIEAMYVVFDNMQHHELNEKTLSFIDTFKKRYPKPNKPFNN